METKIKRNDDGTVDVDEVFKNFSIFGKYHLCLAFLMLLSSVGTIFSAANFILIAAPVKYSCKDLENATCEDFNSTKICSEWIYSDTNSIVAEFDLACQEWKRTLIGTIHSFGYMVGLIFVGPISDRIGRKITMLITMISIGAVGLSKSFSNSYWLYVILEFLEAFTGPAFSPKYMLEIEFVATDKRPTFLAIINSGYSVGGIILAFIGWYFQYWRTYLQVVYAPLLVFIIYYYLLDESPRWLLANDRKDEAIAIIEKIAKRNKIHLDKAVLDRVTCKKRANTGLINLLSSSFASKTLLKRFLVCVVWWVTFCFINNGLAINVVSLEGNKYVNLAILYLISLPAVLLNMMCLLRFMRRKHALILYFFAGGLLCVVQPFVPAHIIWLSITLYMVGKFMTTLYIELTYLFTSELFPTYTRNSIHALCSSIGRTGSILAPQTSLLIPYWSGLPALIFGCTAVFAGFLTFLVPDTTDNALPDTIAQAEKINSKNTKNGNARTTKYGSNDTLETECSVSQQSVTIL